MKKWKGADRRIVFVFWRNSLLALVVLLCAAFPASAGLYYWAGSNSTDWTDLGNWRGATNPVTGGGIFDAVIYVNNGTLNPLYYSATQGTTVFTNAAGEGSGRGMRIGAETANGVLVVSGGSLEFRSPNQLIMGNGGFSGTLVIDGGTYISTNQSIALGYAGAGSATVTVNNGQATIGTLQTLNATRGVVNLNGGTLALGQLSFGGSAAMIVNLNGGTLQALQNQAAWLSPSGVYTVGGAVIIDTAGFSVTNAASLNGLGSVTKMGAGILGLSASNGLGGGINLNAGTLTLNNAYALGSGLFTINGGTLDSQTGVTNANNNALLWNSDFTFVGTKSMGLGSGLLTLSSNRTVTVNTSGLTVGGVVTGYLGGVSLNALDITKAGTGVLYLNADISTLRAGQTNNVTAGTANYNGAITGAGLNALDLVKAGGGTVNFTAPITMTANQTNVANAGTLNYNGVIGDGGGNYSLAFKGAAAITLTTNNTFGGALSVLGGPQVTLSGSNSYNGVTLVTGSGSKLVVNNNNALGNSAGLVTVNSAGLVSLLNGITISGRTLSLSGNGDNNGALQAAAGSVATWAGPVLINDNSGQSGPRIGAQSTGTLTVSGPISNGASGSTLYLSGASGTGKIMLSGTNAYTGSTGIIRGWLILGADNTLPTNTALVLNVANINSDSSTLDMNGHNQIIGQLSSATTNAQPMLLTNTAVGPSTLTVNQSANTVYGGNVGGNLNLIKSGSGTLLMVGTNLALTGTATINAGILQLGTNALNPVINFSATTLNGGTLLVGATNPTAVINLGPTALNGGALLLATTNVTAAITASGTLAVVGPAATLDQNFLNWAAASAPGGLPVLVMNSNGASSLAFSGSLGGSFLGANGSAVTNLNGATWSDGNIRLGGGPSALVYTPVLPGGANATIGPAGGNSASIVTFPTNTINANTSLNIQSGTLQFYNDASLGASPVSPMATNIILNGGAIALVGQGDTALNSNRGFALGNGGGTISSIGGGTFRITGSISDLPGQSGVVTVVNSGVLVFSANNTYSGGTLLASNANLVISGNSAVGTGLLNLNGGLLRASSTALATTYVSNNVVVTGNSALGGANNKNLTFLGGVTLTGNRMLSAGSTDSDTFAGVISDGGNGYSLTKSGAGTFTLANVNTYGGGTIVNGGVLALATNYAPGAGSITLSNGTLRTTGSPWALSNTVQLAVNSTSYLDASSDMILTNAGLAGAGTVVKTSANTLKLWSDNSAFSGTFINSNAATWLNLDTAGSSNANWVIASGTLLFNTDNGGAGRTIRMGTLAGSAGAILRAGGGQTGITTFAVGELGGSTTFAGQLQDGVANYTKTALSKVGPGLLTFTSSNVYSGGSSIDSGTLALSSNGTLGSGTITVAGGATLDTTGLSSGSLAVLSGQLLSNQGTFSGGLIINNGASVSGGGFFNGGVTNLTGGTLTPGLGGDTNFFRSLTLAGGSTNAFWIGSAVTHDLSVVTNSLDVTGTGMPMLKLDLSGYTFVSGDTFLLYDNLFAGAGGLDGTNAYFQFKDVFGTMTNLYNDTIFSASTAGGTATNLFRIAYDFNADGTANDILLSTIPEPATLNLMVMLGIVFWLRRQQQRSRRRYG